MSDIDRRRLLQLASATLFVANATPAFSESCGNAAPGTLPPYTAQFFTANELSLLDQVMEAILPADEQSPGAREAHVPLFADLMVFNSPEDVKQDWRAGLALLSADLRTGTLTDCLDRAAANEHNPQSPFDLFFVKLKQMTAEGYYTSRIGIHQELRYQGNTYTKEFQGCTHVEHQNS